MLAGPDDELSVRFDGRLQFGTAGLRAAVGAGPQRMNRLVVRQAAAGLVDYLLDRIPRAAERGVIIGYDARRKSDVFALDTARVCAARGVRAMIFPYVVPTPVLAWNIVGVDAAAGVMVTASHNPPADNGYKVFTEAGAQIVPPADAEIAACIDEVDPCAVRGRRPTTRSSSGSTIRSCRPTSRRCPAVRLRPEIDRRGGGLHGDARRRRRHLGRRVRPGRAADPLRGRRAAGARRHVPDGRFPNPEEPGAMDLLLAGRGLRRARSRWPTTPTPTGWARRSRRPDGGWRRLQGDEIGWLLADHILRHTSGDDRLVITTLVSSSLLSKMAGRTACTSPRPTPGSSGSATPS